MDAALDSHFDLSSMYTYSPASKCSPALPHQPSRPPHHDQYETSGLRPTVMLTNRDGEMGKVLLNGVRAAL
jgi:hypothetical protein